MLVIRGDDYQSWIYKTANNLIAVDPWLTSKQIFPGAEWLLSRTTDCNHYLVENNLIDKVNYLIITAHFSDHLDIRSINKFSKNIKIYTTHEASKVLTKEGFKNCCIVKPGDTYKIDDLTLEIRAAGKPYHTTSFAYYLKNDFSCIYHEPHTMNENFISDYELDALITTIDQVKVFGLVEVSMNLSKTAKIIDSNNIKYLIPTGTKPTKTKGLISYLLKINEFDEKKFQSINVACKEPHNTLTI